MKRIEEKIITIKSVAEQIIESPVETVVIVKYDRMGGSPGHSDALVKTGINGYKAARGERAGYLKHVDIQGWVESFGGNAEFYFV